MDYYPLASVVSGNSGGSFTGGPPKGLLHTTEGKTIASAVSAYRSANSWPHFTISPENGGRVVQHLPISVAARALRNLSGGVQTNRDHVIQIECVGTSDRRNRDSWGDLYVENWTTAYKNSIKALMRWIEENAGVPRTCSVTFKAYPESYGASNGVRLSGPSWDAYSGWLGHQHAAENLHGDPGLIDIAYLLDAPAPAPPPPIHEFTEADMKVARVEVPTDPEGNGFHPSGLFVHEGQVVGVAAHLPHTGDTLDYLDHPTAEYSVKDSQYYAEVTGMPGDAHIGVTITVA